MECEKIATEKLRMELSQILLEASVLITCTNFLLSNYCRTLTDTVLHKVIWLPFIQNYILNTKTNLWLP